MKWWHGNSESRPTTRLIGLGAFDGGDQDITVTQRESFPASSQWVCIPTAEQLLATEALTTILENAATTQA